MTASIHVRVGTRDAIARHVVQQIAHIAHTAVLKRGVCCLAIPGGSVAEAVLPALASAALPWAYVHVFWVDERIVPISSPDSNVGRAMQLIHGSAMASEAAIHGMVCSEIGSEIGVEIGANSVELIARQCAEGYAKTLGEIAGAQPILDSVLLGVGDDGHVASLFPGHSSLGESIRSVVIETHAPKPPAHRISLAVPVLVRARHVIIAAFGTSKAAVFQDALEHPNATTPLAIVLQQATHVEVVLDHDAAEELTCIPQSHLP